MSLMRGEVRRAEWVVDEVRCVVLAKVFERRKEDRKNCVTWICLVSQLAFEPSRTKRKKKKKKTNSSHAHPIRVQHQRSTSTTKARQAVGSAGRRRVDAQRTGFALRQTGHEASARCGEVVKARQAVDALRQAAALPQAHPFDHEKAKGHRACKRALNRWLLDFFSFTNPSQIRPA